MNPFNQELRRVFLFSSNDLLANRAGRLSPRQQARQQAVGSGLKLGIAFFILVMLGTLGVIAFGSLASGVHSSITDPEMLTTLAIAGSVIGVIIIFGYFSSRKHLAAAQANQIQKAEGEAQHGKIRPDAAHFEIKIGRSKIRLLTPEHLDAFEIGAAYRVYYLPGPTPVILSGELIGTESEAAQFIEAEPPVDDDIILQRQKKARSVVFVLGILTLAFPLALFATASLPGMLPALVFLGLVGVAIFFVSWAIRRVSS
jgi:hypothetical protein